MQTHIVTSWLHMLLEIVFYCKFRHKDFLFIAESFEQFFSFSKENIDNRIFDLKLMHMTNLIHVNSSARLSKTHHRKLNTHNSLSSKDRALGRYSDVVLKFSSKDVMKILSYQKIMWVFFF